MSKNITQQRDIYDTVIFRFLQIFYGLTMKRKMERLYPSKHLLVLKMSWRRLQDMSCRRLQHVFSVTIFRLPKCLEDVLKAFSRPLARLLEDIFKTSLRRLVRRKIVTLKTSSRHLEDLPWRHLEDISWRRLQDMSEANKIFTGGNCI